jgi:hypothetical protein
VFAHQCLEKHLVDFVVGRPVVANNVVCDGFNKLWFKIVMNSFFLKVWIGERRKAFCVVNSHVGVIRTQHVQGKQINYAFFPG